MNGILGQDAALTVLNAALTSGRMHHAWLFHGPVGVGKFTAALQVARTLLCHGAGPSSDGAIQPCGSCESCNAFTRGPEEHPDLHVIRKEQAAVSSITDLRNKKLINIPVDLLRELMIGGWVGGSAARRYIEPVAAKTPLLGHGKVFIIDEADLLAPVGQNALLKTLEEPTPGTYFFLVTSQADRLLPTIRSRCQRVAFGPLDESVMGELVETLRQRIADELSEQIAELQSRSRLKKEEKAQLESLTQQREELSRLGDVDRDAVLRFAHGSAGLADLAMRYRLYRWVQTLEPMIDALGAGRADTRMGPKLGDLADSFAQQWVDRHAGASKDAANKAAVRYLLTLVGEFCRVRLAARAAEAGGDDPDATEKTLLPWLRGVDLLKRAEEQLAANVAPALLLNNLAIQWAARTR